VGFGEEPNLDGVFEGKTYLVLAEGLHLQKRGLVCKANRLLYQSTLGLRVIKKQRNVSVFGPVSNKRFRGAPLIDRNAIAEMLVFCCQTTSASTAPCTSRMMCCPPHCASNGAPCQPLLPAFSGGIRSPPPTWSRPLLIQACKYQIHQRAREVHGQCRRIVVHVKQSKARF